MNTTTAREHWNHWTVGELEKERHGREPFRVEYEQRVVETVLALDIKPQPGRIPQLLDIGIGAGWITERLLSRFEYTGLDLSDVAIESARRRCPGVKLFAVDFLAWDPIVGKYDAVLCVDTVAYFADQEAALHKMWNALRPGGTLIISTLNPFVFERQKWVNERKEKRMGDWLTANDLRALLTGQGFEIESMRTVVPAGDQGWLRVVNARRIKAILGRPYVAALEAMGLGQHRVVVARKAA